MSKENIKQLLDEAGLSFGDSAWFEELAEKVGNLYSENIPIHYDDAWQLKDGYRVRIKHGSWLLKSLGDTIECDCMCFLPLGMANEEYLSKTIKANKESLLNFLEEVKEHRCIPWPG